MSDVEKSKKAVKKLIKGCLIKDTIVVSSGVVVICEGEQPLLWDKSIGRVRGLNESIAEDARIIRGL